ncbi:type IA DNA topoisomerase [Paenibacillus crassostreae]|uniref:DNA topoisomerase n=1 Tax=Paenibacillus crassostreae TaxID=1763538 RepID=A0A167EIA2_9BACL|nr:type IA DNA topoisomerase [Paenibacillus crassostreae]AOZ94888.1 DNA topoisomerase III [Paenibacillus crassostreae]OAB75571.1 DNA topoisomerase III [Paenibacillus crassostreae]
MIIVLAEKPDQARKLAAPFPHTKGKGFLFIHPCKEFPDGAKVTWAIGHLVELKNPDEYHESWKKWRMDSLPIIPEKFEYKVSKDKAAQFKIVKDLLKEADQIIIGTDPAREGENIARLLIMMAGCSHKPIKRLWTSSLTENAIIKGFAEVRDGSETINLFHEAQARQISDWLIGLNASRLYTLHLQRKGFKEVFSVGRVQTPVLTLIYNRQCDINDYKPEPFCELMAEFSVTTGKYTGKFKERYLTKEKLYETVRPHITPGKASYEGVVKLVEVNEKRMHPPTLHNLSGLQALLNKKKKYSPTDVLNTVQSLYEKGFVSYPRSDSQHITEEEFSYLKAHLNDYQQLIGIAFQPHTLESSKRFVNPDKVSDHYAIIPTEKIPGSTLDFTEMEKATYDEIVKSALAMFLPDYIYEETVITTAVGDVDFITVGKTEKSIGWKLLYHNDPQDTDETNEDKALPRVNNGDPATGIVSVKDGITQPPKPYTQGQLITLMAHAGRHVEDKEMREVLNESEGLGTEATRSGIIETLMQREFILVKKNLVYVTPKGEVLCEAVKGTILSKPEMTAQWEMFLKEIGRGNKQGSVFIENTKKLCHKLLEQVAVDMGQLNVDAQITTIEQTESICKCLCGKGYITDRGKFYGCSEYKNGCKVSFNKELLGKKLTPNQIKQLCEKGKTGNIKGFVSKNKKRFEAALLLKDGKIEFIFS